MYTDPLAFCMVLIVIIPIGAMNRELVPAQRTTSKYRFKRVSFQSVRHNHSDVQYLDVVDSIDVAELTGIPIRWRDLFVCWLIIQATMWKIPMFIKRLWLIIRNGRLRGLWTMWAQSAIIEG
jgi:hypothetical protein